MKRLRVILIGLGHDHATSIYDSILRQTELFDAVGFAVPKSELTDFPDKVERYRGQLPMYTIEEILALPNVDGAVVETEEVNLTYYAQLAAERGLHIHMDKPGGLDIAAFDRLIDTVQSHRSAFTTGYMYRFNPKIQEALQKIENGDLGEIYAVETHMDCEHPVSKREWLGRFPGGMMFYLGCHLVDLIYRIQGEPLEVLPMNCSTGAGADDYGMAVFRYPHGVSFAKTCANEPGGFVRRQLVICGSKGTIELKPLESYTSGPHDHRDSYTVMRETYANEGWNTFGAMSESDLFNRYDDMMRHFAEVANGKENPYSYEYERAVYRLLLKACGKES